MSVERQLAAVVRSLTPVTEKRDGLIRRRDELVGQAVGEGLSYRRVAELADLSIGMVQKILGRTP